LSFDVLTVGLLIRPDDAPELPEDEDARLQDGHLAHLASLHDTGALVAAGPLAEQDDPAVRGVALLTVPADEARRLFEDDPRVRAGLLVVRFASWFVPAGAVSFGPADFPRSLAEAAARLPR
jgi:uncharacterized protein YciI